MYLGLDLGTSGLKGAIVDQTGQIIATHDVALKVSRPKSGWSEQAPQDWVIAAHEVFCALQPFLSSVKAIGLSGQMHGATCIDRDGKVIRPCILWNDTRAEVEAMALNNRDDLKDIFGNIVFAGFTAPKINWMLNFEPENFRRIAKVLLPKDYVRFWLTGEYVSEMSDASGTAWLDPAKRSWSQPLLEASQLGFEHMPALVEGSAPSGQLRKSLAQEFGMAQVVVAGGAGDNAATAIGLDIIREGGAFLSLGTSGVVFSSQNDFRPNPQSAIHAFAHCIPNTWHQMAVTLSATDSLNWLARQLGETPENLTKNQTIRPPTSEIFLPFLGGERTPYNSAKLRASFHNLSHDTDRDALVRAVLEGIAFSLKECFDLMRKEVPIDHIVAAGGGANSDHWLELIATIFGKTILRPRGAHHAAALGAARLGAMAINEDIEIKLDNQSFEPREFGDAYHEKFENYLSTVRADL